MPALGLVPLLAAAVYASGAGLGFTGRPAAPVAAPGPVGGGATATMGVGQTLAAVTASTTSPTQSAQSTPVAAGTTAGAAGTATSTGTNATAGGATGTGTTGGAAGTGTAGGAAAGTATSTGANATAGAATGPFHSYRVQPGDTLRVIAQTYGVSVESIRQASGLQDANRLRVGQVLTIPSQPGYLYRVQPGDTLELVAARTGVAADLIAAASNVRGSVKAGDVLLIPDQREPASK